MEERVVRPGSVNQRTNQPAAEPPQHHLNQRHLLAAADIDMEVEPAIEVEADLRIAWADLAQHRQNAA